MLKCKKCGVNLEVTAIACPACGAEVEMGRLTGILGIVCRDCDAYNEPGSKACVSCGKPFPKPALTPSPSSPAQAAPPPQGAPAVRVFGKAGASISPVPAVPRDPGTPGAASPEPGQRGATQVFGALEPGRAKLVLERGQGLDGATFRLNADEIGAGRSQGAVIFPDDPCLAPLHATFFYRDGSLHVRDEGAPGGVFLRLRGLSVPLKPGDLFSVGDRLLRFAGLLPPVPPPPPDGTRRLGSPRPPGVAILVEEWLEGGVGGRVYLRSGPSVTIGRAGCAINLGDDAYLSQAHAEIAVDAGGAAKLRDLGSSNGTFVRLPPRSERMLMDGDSLRMGREVLRVSIA